MTTSEKPESYSASDLTYLEGLDAVRKRPGMYIGSTDTRGLTHCVFEIIDNSVDEALAGHCTEVTLTLHEDGSVQVEDNGRGIPVGIEPKSGLSGVELVFTKLHAGGKFGGSGYQVSGGLHGVGASVVNALSSRLDVEVQRDGKIHTLSFQRGVAGHFGADGTFTPAETLKATKGSAGQTGTNVRFWPDNGIFLKEAVVDHDKVVARLRQTAFLVPGLTLVVVDKTAETPTTEEFHFEGGLADFVDYRSTGANLSETLTIKGNGTFTERVPVLSPDGSQELTDVPRNVEVDIALRWTTGFDADVTSYVNIVQTPKGGTHVSGFERAMVKTINEQLRAQKVLKAAEDPVIKDDAQEGIVAVISVKLPEPQFEGQTKEVLGTRDVAGIVATVLAEGLTAYFTARKTKDEGKKVLTKIAEASRTRLAAREAKETRRRKTALESSSMPAKLVDCRNEDMELTELFIVEGDSALGTFKQGRDSDYQAALPIRGKILNTLKASQADMLRNAECAAIIQVLGCGFGKDFDMDTLRYGKLIFLADADVDGAHIRCLLLTLVYRYLRPLLAAGRVYAAVPPLHQIKVGSGKSSEVHYTYDDDEMKTLLEKLRKAGKTFRDDSIQRYKGLGEMDSSQLWETTLDPEKRHLRRVTMPEAEKAATAFDVCMGENVPIRRDFLVEFSASLDLSAIDI